MANLEHKVKPGRHSLVRTSRQHSFTLVELLVTIAILAILLLLVGGILNQVSSTYTQISSQIDRHQNGRTILAMIASDLRPAALPIDRSNLYNLQLLVDPTNLVNVTSPTLNGGASSSQGGGYLNAHAIFWQAPIATANLNGASGKMAEVGYFVRWVNPASSNPRAILCRFFVNPGDPNYVIYSQPTAWLTPACLDSAAPGYSTTGTTVSQIYPGTGWFADNVIGLWVRCLDANGAPIVYTAATSLANAQTVNYSFDSRLGYLTPNPSATSAYIAKTIYQDVSPASGIIAPQILATLPSTIEVAIVVIDAQTANRVTKVPSYAPAYPNASTGANSPYNNNSPVNFWNDINYFISQLPPVVARGAHVYAIRVPLVNGG